MHLYIISPGQERWGSPFVWGASPIGNERLSVKLRLRKTQIEVPRWFL